jgi:hypothetical protein
MGGNTFGIAALLVGVAIVMVAVVAVVVMLRRGR